jgi:hypothetical protein
MGTYDLFVRKKLFRNFGSQEFEKLLKNTLKNSSVFKEEAKSSIKFSIWAVLSNVNFKIEGTLIFFELDNVQFSISETLATLIGRQKKCFHEKTYTI